MRNTITWLLLCGTLWANSLVKFSYTQSISDALAYNNLYCGAKSGGPYVKRAQSKTPVTTMILNLPPGTYYCVVTVVDIDGEESVYSNQTKVIVTK